MYTSTTGFKDACPSAWGTVGIGGILDAKVRDVIGTFANASIHNLVTNNGGAVVAVIFLKQNNSYYAGITFTYHGDAGYGGGAITYFACNNGAYTVKVFSNPQ